MIWFLLLLLPLAAALAYLRTPLLGWFLAGLLWLSVGMWLAGWPTLASTLMLLLYIGAIVIFAMGTIAVATMSFPVRP